MAQTVLSGKSGALQLLAVPTLQDTLRDWRIAPGGTVNTYVASNTDGMQGQVDGNDDWTLSANFYGHTPVAFPGSAVAVKAYTGTDSYSGTGIVDSFTLNVDVEGGGIVTGSIQVSSNGALSSAQSGAVTDSSDPNPPSAIGLKIAWGDTPADRNIRRYSFTITSDNKTYVDSATAGVVKRVAGTLSASGSWDEYESGTGVHVAKGTMEMLRCYVTSSAYYEFKYALITGLDNAVNVESGDIVGVTHNWAFSGFKGGTKGQLLKPDTTAFWS